MTRYNFFIYWGVYFREVYFVDCLTERLGNFVYGDKILFSCFLGFFLLPLSFCLGSRQQRQFHALEDAHSGSEANILCYAPTGAREREGNSVVGLKCLAVKSPNTSMARSDGE